jgi:hypothetical protein
MTESNTTVDTIQSAITQLSEDKEIFDKFEIDSRYIERYVGKYRRTEGNTKVFDYWHNEFTKIKNQVENINAEIEKYRRAFLGQFENCYSCVNILREELKQYPANQISQIRANIDLLTLKTTIMIIYKTTGGGFPEDNETYNNFLKAIYDAQEKCNAQYHPIQYVFKSLFQDENVSTNLLQHEFPISIRL